MEKMCRLCCVLKVEFNEIEDEEKFRKCTGIQEFSINNGLSKNCCDICNEKINDICLFQNQCKKADLFLKKLLKIENESMNIIEFEDYKQHDNIEKIEYNIHNKIMENADLKNSQKVVIIQPKVSCKKCNKCFTCEKNLKTHVTIVHKDKDNIRGNLLETDTLIENEELNGDFLNLKTVSCNNCNKCFATEGNLKLHKYMAHKNYVEIDDNIEKLFKVVDPIEFGVPCDQCDRCFATERNLKIHKYRAHKNDVEIDDNVEKLFKIVDPVELDVPCDQCDRWFATERNLKIHKYRAHKNDVEIDDNVEKLFKIVDPVELDVPCDQCDRCFATERNLKIHKYRAHKNDVEIDDNVEKLFKIVDPVELDVPCDQCDRCFATERNLKIHKYRAHKNDVEIDDNVEKLFKIVDPVELDVPCDQCDRCFATERNLKIHKYRAHKNDVEIDDNVEKLFKIVNLPETKKVESSSSSVRCKKCKKSFKCERNLKIHISIVHTELTTIAQTSNDNNSNSSNNFTDISSKFDQHYLKQISKYYCDLCGLRFTQKQFLIAHLKIKHLKVMKYTCKLCWKGFVNNEDVYSHFIKVHCHQKIKPTIVKIGNYFIYQKREHSNALWKAAEIPHTSNTVNDYSCKLCDKTFISKLSLKFHFSSVHLKLTNIIHKCDICQKIYRFKYSLVKHQKIHNRIVKYNCKVCDLGFNTKTLFYSHLNHTHFKKTKIDNVDNYLLIKKRKSPLAKNPNYFKIANYRNRYRCDYCKDTFITKYSLKNHMKQKHDVKNMIIRNRLKCSICNEIFRQHSLYKNHMKINHPEEYSLQIRVNCTICNKSLTKKSIRNHLKTHKNRPKNIQCEECGKTFFAQSSYLYHMKTHTNERPFKCSQCSKAFYTKHQLISHSYIHSDVERPKKYQCNYCGKGCASTTEFTVHLRIHTKERPFKCTQCGKGFLTKSHLRNHSYSHSGERNYKCPEIGCKKAYTSGSTLKKHYYSVHYPEEKKTFQCDLCPKKFGQRTFLNQHRKAHGKIAKMHKS